MPAPFPWMLLLLASPAAAEEPSEPRETVVTAERVPTPLARTPAAVSVVEVEDAVAATPAIGMEEALSTVPGVVARGGTNAAQDLRLSIRGFGARSAFGIRGVTLLVDGFPETLPDGQAQVDALDIATVERIEVLRGLAASLYGNAAGGVIRLDSARAGQTPSAGVRASAGSFGLFKVLGQASTRGEVAGVSVSISRLDHAGYRNHARAEQTALNVLADAKLGGGDLLVAFAGVDAPRADDPGGLTLEELREDPTRAAPNNLRFVTGEALRQGRLGVSWRGQTSPDHHLEVIGWGAQRRFRSAIPFNTIAFDRVVGGVGVRSTVRHGLGPLRGRLSAGLEGQLQSDDRANAPNVNGEPVGALTLSQDERVRTAALSVQEELSLTPHLTVVAGGRFDLAHYEVIDALTGDGDGSGARLFTQPTGRLGAIWAPSPALAVYAQLSQAFETPTTTELVDLSRGGFNPEVRPQRADGLELGARGEVGSFRWDAALFGVRVVDGLVRQEDAQGRAFYVNAAQTRHLGAELAVTGELPFDLFTRFAWTVLDARFVAYAPRGEELGGNVVPGIPHHHGALVLGWRHDSGGVIEAEAFTVGGRFADDENLVREPLQVVFDARARWPVRLGEWQLAPFAGVRNLLSTPYSDALRINAIGARHFEPAPSLTVHGGLSVDFTGAEP